MTNDAPKTLDACATYVKSAMLRYPSIFPTRISVLEHALVTIGCGVEWKNGIIVEERVDGEPPMPDDISYADLDRHIEYFSKRPGDWSSAIAKYEAERKERRRRARKIDVLATKVDPKAVIRRDAKKVMMAAESNHGMPPMMNIWRMARGTDPSWIKAAEEVFDAIYRNGFEKQNHYRAMNGLSNSILMSAKGWWNTTFKVDADWEPAEAAKQALKNRGFVEATGSSNGSGYVAHYYEGEMDEKGLRLFIRAMKRIRRYENEQLLTSSPDGMVWTWEDSQWPLVIDLRPQEGKPNTYRPRTYFISHPEDSEACIKGLLHNWDFNGRRDNRGAGKIAGRHLGECLVGIAYDPDRDYLIKPTEEQTKQDRELYNRDRRIFG
jgi:hypothetical protein